MKILGWRFKTKHLFHYGTSRSGDVLLMGVSRCDFHRTTIVYICQLRSDGEFRLTRDNKDILAFGIPHQWAMRLMGTDINSFRRTMDMEVERYISRGSRTIALEPGTTADMGNGRT